ncbi:AAA family ATPase [Clostridium gasigenes]|uniref:AAA family ATPase n=1 Tax=Clostridium gasigenes TaxID=94869 RepID=UPI001C0AC43F|nr:ATP-binding protein [Clostridium gasigenes]MBU3104411.1 ATP-binding protein [Clostridium gasigenes]MBU3136955.1 ATP-binding protein [Clostridium gasigenes]
MKIVSIKLINDRVLGSVEFDFTNSDGEIVNTIILAGENGVGKTRLLDIIYKFSSSTLRSYELRTNEAYEFEIQFDEDELLSLVAERAFVLNTRDSLLGNRITFILDCGLNNEYSKIRYVDSYNNINEVNSDFILRQEARKYILTSYSTTQVNFKVQKINGVTAKKMDEEISTSLLQNENLATEIAQLLVDISASDDTEVAQWVKSNIGEVVPNDIIEVRMKRFKMAFEYMFPAKKMIGIENKDGCKVVLFEENGMIMNIDELSSGEKQIVFRGGFLLKDNKTNNGIILIDEPEISLHPTWQMKISEFFRMLYRDSNGNDKNQIIITTHSPFIIHNDYRKNDKILILKKDEFGKVLIEDEAKYYGWKSEELIKEAFNTNMFIDRVKDNIGKPLIITEGKTDWKHLKNALDVLKSQGKFNALDIDFLEYDRDMSDSNLEKLLNTISILDNDNKIIGLFDNDEKIGRKYDGEAAIEFGNKIYGWCIPNPRNLPYGISIEFLYKDEDIKKYDKDGRRLYLSDEFKEINLQFKSDSSINCTNKKIIECYKNDIVKIIDNEVFDAEEKSLALSKNQFAENILRKIEPFDEVNVEHFEEVFRRIEKILEI